jgi:hypothetical protein
MVSLTSWHNCFHPSIHQHLSFSLFLLGAFEHIGRDLFMPFSLINDLVKYMLCLCVLALCFI